MKVLVTGATGFLGRRLVRALLDQGHCVRCLVRSGSDISVIGGATVGTVEIVTGSLAQERSCVAALQGCDTVYHVAAAMGGGAAVLFTTNVIATRQLAALAIRERVRRFVLVSSLGVYGTDDLRRGDTLDESCPLDPHPHLRDPYSYSKIAQEQAAWEARAEGLPLVVVRPGVIYGPGRGCMSSRLGLQLGPNLLLKMGGRQRLPYTFVDNCAKGIALAGTVAGVEGQAFNLIDTDELTAHSLVRSIRREVRRMRVLPVPHLMISPLSGMCEWYHRWSNGQLPAVLTRYKSGVQWKRLRYSNKKAVERLGWRPEVSLRDGLCVTFAWMREQMARAVAAA